MNRPISDEVTVITQQAQLPEKREAKSDRGAHLIVLSGSNVGQVFNLKKTKVSLGRDDASDLQILDAGISRNHAIIRREADGGYVLEDAGSRNGTFANAKRVEAPYRLRDGDKVQLGVMTVLKFTRLDDPEANYAKLMYDAAHRDALTGVFNRRYFEDKLRTEFAYCARHRAPIALVMMDLDKFKSVNDTYGHPVGDEVLKEFAARVGSAIRAEDALCRYGGEEFVLLCRQTAHTQALSLCERIRQAVGDLPFQTTGGALTVTTSVGGVALPDPTITSPEAMLAAADECLYAAKTGGRNRVVMRPPSAT